MQRRANDPMTQLTQLIVEGISSGGIYGLVALGLVLSYKATEVLNFAQGDLVMLSAFLGWGRRRGGPSVLAQLRRRAVGSADDPVNETMNSPPRCAWTAWLWRAATPTFLPNPLESEP
jgi:hypothetical protein